MLKIVKDKIGLLYRKKITGAILSIGMLVAVLAVIFFAWMSEEVYEGEGVKFDTGVREFIHGYASEWLTQTMQIFAFLGSTVFLTVVSVLAISLFLFLRKMRSAVILAVVMAGAIILNNILKVSFSRSRPLPYFDTPLPTSFSYPSGHALFSVCFYCCLAWLVASLLKGTATKICVWTAAILMALFIGLSRVYLGVHYPTDVLAGYTAAFVWLAVVKTANSVMFTPTAP